MQLLLYIQEEDKIGKSQVVNVIKLGFWLLFCKADFILAAPTKIVASNIKKSTIHTCSRISVRNNQRKTNKVSSM